MTPMRMCSSRFGREAVMGIPGCGALARAIPLLAALMALAGCLPPGGPGRPPAGAPAAPGSVHAEAGDAQVTVAWESIPGAESYNLYWLPAPGVNAQTGNRIVGARSPYLHKELANGIPYFYVVMAVRNGVEGSPSAIVSAVPKSPEASVLSAERPEIRTSEFVAVLVKPGDSMASLAQKYLGDAKKAWWIADFNMIETVTPGMELIIPFMPFDKGGVAPNQYRAVPILTYHNISKTETNVMTVSEKAFEEQMRYLKSKGYRALKLDELYDFIKLKSPLPEKAVVITFDDGWRSTYEIGLPILKKHGLPATLFIYTDFVGQNDKALTWEMVAELQANGVDIQCHTKSHRDLSKMNEDEQLEKYFNALNVEMSLPSQMVMEKLKHRCDYLAYPYGATNRLVSALAEKHGYRLAFTVNRGSAPFFEDFYRIDRSMIYGTYDMAKFEQNLVQFRSEALQ